MTQTNQTKRQGIYSTLRAMNIGDKAVFSAPQLRSVKVACCEYGFMSQKKYTTSINREDRTIMVTRLK